MLKLRRFACEGLETGCVTDEARPRFSFVFESGRQGASLREVTLEVNGWTWRGTGRASVRYDGAFGENVEHQSVSGTFKVRF